MKEKLAYSSDRDVFFVPLLSLRLQYQAMLPNAAASAAPCNCRSLFVNEYGAIGDTGIVALWSGAADIQKQLNYSTHRFWFFACLQNHKGANTRDLT